MRRYFFLLGLFLLALCQPSFAGVLDKEFSFDLALGETSKTSEITVDFPSGESGRFIGREFTPVVVDPDTALYVLEERLTATTYWARICSKAITPIQKPRSAKLQVALETGSALQSDVPLRPDMVGWTFGKIQTLNWKGQGDTDGAPPHSARYLYYLVQDPVSSDTVDTRVVPVWNEGFRIPFTSRLIASQGYILTLQFSNHSGLYSSPLIIRMGKNGRPLKY